MTDILLFLQLIKMISILKFILFNVLLGLLDMSTDLATFFTLMEDHHPLWAALTGFWMSTSFLVHAAFFTFRCQINLSHLFKCLHRISKDRCLNGTTGYNTYGDLALGFYKEAAVHLPFVLPIHNLWRAKQLNGLRFGQTSFRSRDSAEVEQILFEAGKGSYAETMYEAGPQSVTQVPFRVIDDRC